MEEEYKRKYNQILCWRFLRSVAFIDQEIFNQKNGDNNNPKYGDVQQLAKLIYNSNP